MTTGSLLWFRHNGCFHSAAPFKYVPAPRIAFYPPAVAVSGYRNYQFACSVRFLCPKSVIPIKKGVTVRRDTIARSEDSLGGNSKTIIIANISPSNCCALETLSTLKFAQRAKFIRNNAIVNEDASGDVISMRLQIQQLMVLDASSKPNDQSNSGFQSS